MKKPKFLIADLDSMLFRAASSVEKPVYTYHTPEGEHVASFDRAYKGKRWIESIEMLGFDYEHNFTGNYSDLIRTKSVEVGKAEDACKMFDHLLEEMLDEQYSFSNFKKWKGKVASKSGAPCFRNSLCTIKPYKGNRNGGHPYYLEDVRVHALSYPEISKTIGGLESDDVVVATARKYGSDCLGLLDEKDGFQMKGCWQYAPSLIESPIYSCDKIVGELWWDGDKWRGIGDLALLFQAVAGDGVDNYGGCEGMGVKRTHALLEPFSGLPASDIEKPVHAILDVFRNVYGEEYEYQHCYSGQPIVASYKDVFTENLLLAYMVGKPGEQPINIMEAIDSFN